MRNERDIKYAEHDDFQDATSDLPEAVRVAAIGYLATWGLNSDRYYRVAIYGNHDGEMTANYYDVSGAMTYQIGAVLNNDGTDYSFHS